MRWRKLSRERYSALLAAVLSACALGALFFFSRLGDPLERASYDTPFRFIPDPPQTDVVIVVMNESTYDDPELNGTNEYPLFDRSTHARFVDRLAADGARLIVFDLFFGGPEAGDALLAQAIRKHGRVVLAAQIERIEEAEFVGARPNDPPPQYVNLPGCTIASPGVVPDAGVVRSFPREGPFLASIPMAAATLSGVKVESNPPRQRWVRFYGDRGTLPAESYQTAIRRPPGYFANKVVFIGGKPEIDFVLGQEDEFNTAVTRSGRKPMRGVEVHAMMFLNLVRGEWIERLAPWAEFLVILLAGVAFGFLATKFKPLRGAFAAFAVALAVTVAAIVVFWTFGAWMNWMIVAWIQMPVAWGAAALVHSRRIEKEKVDLEQEFETIKGNLPHQSANGGGGSGWPALEQVKPVENNDGTIHIPDFDLLRVIGEGAYGQVWLARSLIGGFRAVKIVFRSNSYPFESEFNGVRNFGEISRMHPGWMAIFHVGKDEEAGFFYYVMEPADDLVLGRMIDPARYVPKTLGKVLVERRWLPVNESIELGIKLADALAALHRLEYVHRDVKPSNIIFVNGAPKLADIGLVAPAGVHKSGGTVDYIPNEGMGTPQADIFSLGRVLYQVSTGGDPRLHPELPDSVSKRKDARELMQLMEIINTACAAFHGHRYASAADLREDLIHLQRRLYRKAG